MSSKLTTFHCITYIVFCNKSCKWEQTNCPNLSLCCGIVSFPWTHLCIDDGRGIYASVYCATFACRRFGTKPLSGSMLPYWLDTGNNIPANSESKYNNFHTTAEIEKCRHKNDGNLVLASICENIKVYTDQIFTQNTAIVRAYSMGYTVLSW